MKNIRIALMVLFLFAFAQPQVWAQKRNVNNSPTSALLKFKTIESSPTIKTFEQGKAVLLVYFRTDCDDCNQNMKVLGKMASRYPAQIWMVSPEAMPKLQVFEDMYGLYEIESVHILQDHLKMMHTWYDFKWLPFVVLYDENGKELQRFDKLPDAQTVSQLLEKR